MEKPFFIIADINELNAIVNKIMPFKNKNSWKIKFVELNYD